jgi:hypothetical protein
MKGWRTGLIFRLLHRFGDPAELRDQQEDEEYKQFLRERGDNCEAPGEPEREELLRLLGEEIASVGEEFECAEKANEERAEIERDACLAPEGDTWRMMLRQEAALDRSIDRKVRILMRLRKESNNPPVAPPGQDDGVRMENIEETIGSDISPEDSQGLETVEDLKMNEQYGNVLENKGSASDNRDRSRNIAENKYSYAQNVGILLKTKGVDGRSKVVEGSW